jgi:predicted RNase H-like nuclease (RuvC/YqgF family)
VFSPCGWSGLSVEREKQGEVVSFENPVIMDIIQRVTRLEEKFSALEKMLSFLKEKIEEVESVTERIDERTWFIVAGVVISILVQILIAVLK